MLNVTSQQPSHVLMGITQGGGGAAMPLTPLGEACLRMDLTAIHEILENLAYKDDEGVTTEVLLFWFDLFFSKSTFMALMSHDFLKLVCSCHSICGQIRCRTH